MYIEKLYHFIIIFIHLDKFYCVPSSIANAGVEKETISMKIYSLSPAQWIDTGKKIFEDEFISTANKICGDDPNFCGLNQEEWADFKMFTASHIDYVRDSPLYESALLNIEFSVLHPSSDVLSKTNDHAVSIHKQALSNIAKNMTSRFERESGYHVLLVEDDYYPLKPPIITNVVIIPLALLVTTILLLILLVCIRKSAHPMESIKSDPEDV